MSGAGNCYDYAVVETFFKTIKAELLWQTRREAEIAVINYINGFYNPRWRNSVVVGRYFGTQELLEALRLSLIPASSRVLL
jgi:transposase InsO family protein